MRVYIAGPMTGYDEHNFPAFHKAAKEWRAAGHEVVSPAEMDGEASHEDLAKVPWNFFLIRDIKLLVDCDAIALLSGWKHSAGATLEHHIANKLGLHVLNAAFPISKGTHHETHEER